MTQARKAAAAPAVDAALAKTHARQDRLLKLTAADGSRVAIAYWGGTLRLADASGKVAGRTATAARHHRARRGANDRLLAGLADGRILALQSP